MAQAVWGIDPLHLGKTSGAGPELGGRKAVGQVVRGDPSHPPLLNINLEQAVPAAIEGATGDNELSHFPLLFEALRRYR